LVEKKQNQTFKTKTQASSEVSTMARQNNLVQANTLVALRFHTEQIMQANRFSS
jgi:hypothetical protein